MSSLAKKIDLWANISHYSPYLEKMISRFAEGEHFDLSQIDADDIYKGLRDLKNHAALHAACQDINQEWDVHKVTNFVSEVADECVKRAFDFVLSEFQKSKIFKQDSVAENSGLSLIALGKWGAHELNYSSDIDFMVVFNPEKMPIEDAYMAQKFAVRFVQDLVDVLNKQTKDGYVYRCDLRLRPDPGATQIAVSIKACEVYYGSLGQNWERAAMIKARHVVGDTRLADEFFTLMQQWIWRRHLDFSTIQDIVSLKNQMEVSALRDFKTDVQVKDLFNLDIKRGTGGIREVELFVQIQQLIFGGRDATLRVIKTCEGLKALAEKEIIGEDLAHNLIKAYEFLRHVEHRLQMKDDRQTHSLPDNGDDFELMVRFCGFDTATSFIDALQKHRQTVSDAFVSLYEDTDDLTAEGQRLVFTGAGEDRKTIETLKGMGFSDSSYIAERIRDWHHGSYRSLNTERSRQILTRLVPVILDKAAKSPMPDQAFKNFDRFLGCQQSGVYMLSLLDYNAHILETLFKIFSMAPRMSGYLMENPEQLEALLTEKGQDFALPDREALIERVDAYLTPKESFEDRLYDIAHWSKQHRFLASLNIINQKIKIEDSFPYLSDVAEVTLFELLKAIQSKFEGRHGRIEGGVFSIVGLGRFGSRQMTVGSDLDIVMVYDAAGDAMASDGEMPLTVGQYYARLMQRLNTALTSQTKYGHIYRTDLRLRPHGDAGAMAIKRDDFKNYYLKEAWPLEIMSLIRARAISFDAQFADIVNADIKEILTQERDAQKWEQDIDDLRDKTLKEFKTDDVWDVKYHRGGLMDVMFDIQGRCLIHAHKNPEILCRSMIPIVETMKDAGILPSKGTDHLIRKITLLKRLQTIMRMTGKDVSGLSQNLVLYCFKGLDLGEPRTIPEAEDALENLYSAKI